MQILLKEVPTDRKPLSLEQVQRDQLNLANQRGLKIQLQQADNHRLLRLPFLIQDITLKVPLFVPLANTRTRTAATEMLVHGHNNPAPIPGKQFLAATVV